MSDYAPPPVKQHSSSPPGVMPKNLQAWVIGGIALVMSLIIAFSGSTTPKDVKPLPPPGATAADPNAARINEYRNRIDDELARLMREQAARAETSSEVNSGARRVPRSSPQDSALGTAAGWSGAAVRPERGWIEEDRERRRYESRYAPSVALSRRPPLGRPQLGSPQSGWPQTQTSLAGPGLAQPGMSQTIPAGPQTPRGPTRKLLEGTVIETVLTNRLDGTFSGPVDCLVTTPVYSQDRRHEVVPRGSRVLGTVKPVEAFGQQRLAIAFHRLILPDKTSVRLDGLPGLNQQGETGLVDLVNRHYGQIFGTSLAIGAIAGLAQAGTAGGSGATTGDLYRQGVATSLSQSSLNILDRFLNVLPTFTVREGQRIKVYLTGDLDVPVTTNTPGGVS